MQEGYEDYYGDEESCCLTCSDYKKEDNRVLSDYEEGKCLCYDCRCRKCYWYANDYPSSGGHCEFYEYHGDVYGDKFNHEIEITDFLKETEKAHYCRLTGVEGYTAAYYWIPKSQIDEDRVTNWWLEQKNLI